MVFHQLDDADFALELSSLDSTLDDDFFSGLTGEDPYDPVLMEDLDRDALPCVELLVYCDVSSKKVSKLVGVYMRTLIKLYNSRGAYVALDWRFASRTDSPTRAYTIPVFFYSATFVKSSYCVRGFCESNDNAIFVVIDPSISPDHETFASTAQQHILGKSNPANIAKIRKIAERLKSLDGIQRLKFPNHVPAYENSQKLLKSVEAVMPTSPGSPGCEELVIEVPSREDMKLDYAGYENMPPLLDTKLFDSFGLPVDSVGTPVKPQLFSQEIVKRKRKKCAEEDSSVYMNSIPKRQFRVKGQIYVVNKIRKKWDGRQWRRLCQYKNCDHAARGSITYCVSHYKLKCAQPNTCMDDASPAHATGELKDGQLSHVPLDLDNLSVTKPKATIRTY